MKTKRKSKEIRKSGDSDVSILYDTSQEAAFPTMSEELSAAINSSSQSESIVTLRFDHLQLSDLYPKYSYNLETKDERSDLKEMLYFFLESNESLLNPDAMPNTVSEFYGFSQGFQRAIALVNLWLDSLA